MMTGLVSRRETEFTGRKMLIVIISFFAVIIGVNLSLAYFATASWPGLVVANGYIASQNFSRDARIAREQQALGWKTGIDAKHDRLQIVVHDRQGTALHQLRVLATLRRPATADRDFTVELQERGSGVYETPVDLAPGLWDVDVTVYGENEQAVRSVHRVYVRNDKP
jgi:nitrogen fixation protein FixH